MDLFPLLDGYIILIVCIMVLSGTASGIISVLFSRKRKRLVLKEMVGYALLGVLASLMVPLLLHIFSSNLLENSRSSSLNILVFIGFCLIFSLGFIKIFEMLTGFQLKVVYFEDDKLNTLDKNDSKPDFKSVLADAGISEESYKILNTMGGSTQTGKSLSSLLKDSGLEVDKVNEEVSTLMAQGYIKQKLNDQGRLCLYLSPHAVNIVKNVTTEAQRSKGT